MTFNLKSPESWQDITLKQYVELLKLPSKFDLEDELEKLKYRLEQVSILNPEYTPQDLQKLTLSQVKDYFESIDFINNDPVLEECRELIIEGKKYTFQEFKYITLEQWIDTEKFSNLDMAHKLIAIFYIHPDEYTPQELDKVSNYLLQSPATKYFWSVSFFLFIHQAYGLAIKAYSDKIVKQGRVMKRTIQLSQSLNKKLKRVASRFGYK